MVGLRAAAVIGDASMLEGWPSGCAVQKEADEERRQSFSQVGPPFFEGAEGEGAKERAEDAREAGRVERLELPGGDPLFDDEHEQRRAPERGRAPPFRQEPSPTRCSPRSRPCSAATMKNGAVGLNVMERPLDPHRERSLEVARVVAPAFELRR